MSKQVMTKDDWNDIIGQGFPTWHRAIRVASAADLMALFSITEQGAELSAVADSKRLAFAILDSVLAAWQVTIPIQAGRHMLQVAGIHPKSAKRLYTNWVKEVAGDWPGRIRATRLGANEKVSNEYLGWIVEQMKVVPFINDLSRNTMRNGTEKAVAIKVD